MTIQQELIQSLEANAHSTAIENGSRCISYSDLLTSSNKISSYLINKKLERGTIIGVLLDDKIDIIRSIIGIINAQCVFVLLDGALPQNRLESVVKDLNLVHLLTSSNQKASLCAWSSLEVHFLENILDEEKELISLKYPDFEEEDSIYIYFTSGSTGKPKGIVGRNNSLLQFLKWEISQFSIDNSFRISQFISPYFDAFLRDIFVPLLSGGVICIPPAEDDFFTPEKLTSWIDQERINLIHCVPSLFRVFSNPNLTENHFQDLKYILLSGEKIHPVELINWYNTFKDRIQLVNLYGATETTMIRSCYLIRPEDAGKSKISIGQPIYETQLSVANEAFEACNKLISGDLYIITDYTTKGYLNAPELTHEKFISYTRGDKKTIAFKTGDTARVLANGDIDLLGRNDRQVKLRGIRIELDEIENTLAQSPVVKNVVVIKHSEKAENKQNRSVDHSDEFLIGFVIRDTTATLIEPIEELLKSYLREFLPSYMIPQRIVEISRFPLLQNGKINFNELLLQSDQHKIVAPVNEVEIRLLTIWKEILGDKDISTTDSFHTIGGNSLAIMKLIGKIYKEYTVRIPLSDLFNNLTIQKQTALILKSRKDYILTVIKSELKETYNLSSAQERMYYHYELNPQSTTYNMPMAWKIIGEFDKVKIQKVLRLLIERHESLRTEFEFKGNRCLQVIRDIVEFTIEEIDSDNIDVAILGFIRPFNLSSAPLFRAGVISSNNGEKILVVDVHHIVCDGKSQINLFYEFLKVYNEEMLPPLSLQYKDFAEWEYNVKTSDYYMSNREFWLKNFEDKIPQLQLPVTVKSSDEISGLGGSVTFDIERECLRPILETLAQDNVTTFSTLFSIFYLYLSQLTGQEDIVIGINTAGRLQEEMDGVVGMFTKTLPIRYKLDADTEFFRFVKNVHEHLVQANSRQIYDLVDIVNELNHNRVNPEKSLFDIMFVFQNFENITYKTNDVEFAVYELKNTTSKYPLTLVASEENDRFTFRLEYSDNYFNHSDSELLSQQFQLLLSAVSEKYDAKIVDIINVQGSFSQPVEDNITFNFN